MPTSTYVALATVTLESAANSVTFASIPSTYRDLIVVAERKVTSGANSEKFYLNADTNNSNYTRVAMYGTGSSALSYSGTNSSTVGLTTTSGLIIYQLMDASATDKHKTFLYREDKASVQTLAGAHRWASTSAVTSIEVEAESNTYAIGSTFSLYGIEA